MLHYYPQHADKFRDEALVKCSNKCIEQVLGLGLESEGLTYPYLFYPPNLTAHSTRRLDSMVLKMLSLIKFYSARSARVNLGVRRLMSSKLPTSEKSSVGRLPLNGCGDRRPA